METIEKILERIKVQDAFPTIRRGRMDGFDMDEVFNIFVAIGKTRTPAFSVDEYNRFAYRQMVNWLYNQDFFCIDPDSGRTIAGDPTKGLYIAGGTGSGKSWSVEILSLLAKVDRPRFMGSGGVEEITFDAIRADELTTVFSNTGTVEAYAKKSILCIQDLGSEPRETLYMGNRQNVLKQLLEYRGDRQDLITIITSNNAINDSDTKELYGERVVSRLCGMCNYLILNGPDRRIK